MADAAYVTAFKAYLREEPTFMDLPAMEREFYGESDRAIAVLQAALVEVALEGAIKRNASKYLSGSGEASLWV